MNKTEVGRPHRIAYLTGEYPTISHTFILREVEALRAQGFDVHTCAVRQTGADQHRGPAEKAASKNTFYILKAARNFAKLVGAQGRLLRKPGRYFSTLSLAWRTRAPGLRAAIYQLFYFVEATILAQHLEEEGVTHLHNHFAGPSASVAMLTSALTGIQFSFTLHGPADLAEPKRWRIDEKIARAAFVSCISHFARSQAMLHADPAHWDKLWIVHCGVLPDLYENQEIVAPSTSENPIELLFVGRLAAVKGLRILIEALELLRDEIPNLHLRLVGDGPDRQALEMAARPLGEMVEFLGYRSQDEVAKILQTSDALVLPSFAEGVPVVLMEAMASERPVIATRVAGVAELVEDGVSGHLVAPGDAVGLAQAIRHLAMTSDRCRSMGASGRTKVVDEFNITQEAARLAALFTETPGKGPRPTPWTGAGKSE